MAKRKAYRAALRPGTNVYAVHNPKGFLVVGTTTELRSQAVCYAELMNEAYALGAAHERARVRRQKARKA